MAGIGGIIGAVLGWIGYQVGQRTDTASTSGSVHAKLGSILASSNIKSWQRVTGTSNLNNALTLSITSVDPSKCLVFVDGCRFNKNDDQYAYSPVPSYVSAFSATSITLTISGAPIGGSTSAYWTNGVHSVIIVEFY